MKRRDFLTSSVAGTVAAGLAGTPAEALAGEGVRQSAAPTRRILIAGGGFGTACPKELSTVQCLGFLKGSHCPHYDAEPGRRPLYHKLIGSGQMKPGYACDNDAGIYFEDNTVKRVVATRADADVFHVSLVDGKVVEKPLPADRIA